MEKKKKRPRVRVKDEIVFLFDSRVQVKVARSSSFQPPFKPTSSKSASQPSSSSARGKLPSPTFRVSELEVRAGKRKLVTRKSPRSGLRSWRKESEGSLALINKQERKARWIDRLLIWPQSKTEEGTQQVKSNPKTTFI